MSRKVVLSNSVTAFLKYNSHYILIKRSPNKDIAPNVWSGVGGHTEPYEINDPELACLREIYEETGITSEHISNLELRYIVIRRTKNTIRQSYIYFGKTDIPHAIDTDEGTLHLVDEKDLIERKFTQTFGAMLKHYINTPDEQGRVIVGIAENADGELHMSWAIVEDFE